MHVDFFVTFQVPLFVACWSWLASGPTVFPSPPNGSVKPMKFLVLCVLLFVAVAAVNVTVKRFGNDRCTGPFQTFSFVSGTCERGDERRNISGREFLCPTGPPTATCANMSIFPRSDNCSDQPFDHTVMCGKCSHADVPDIGYFIYTCNQKDGSLVAGHQCDPKCSSCNITFTLKTGVCTHITEHNFTHSVKLNAIATCPPMINMKNWINGVNCTGGEVQEIDLIENDCYFGHELSCPAQQPRMHSRNTVHRRADKPLPGKPRARHE